MTEATFGGGDIQIFNEVASSAAVVRLSGEEDDASEQTVRLPTDSPRDTLNATPPSRGESRCGVVENKVFAQQTQADVRLQLQANMLMTCAQVLRRQLDMRNTRRARVDPYPVLLWHATGPALKLLKLTLQFGQHGLQFEELFHLAQFLMCMSISSWNICLKVCKKCLVTIDASYTSTYSYRNCTSFLFSSSLHELCSIITAPPFFFLLSTLVLALVTALPYLVMSLLYLAVTGYGTLKAGYSPVVPGYYTGITGYSPAVT